MSKILCFSNNPNAGAEPVGYYLTVVNLSDFSVRIEVTLATTRTIKKRREAERLSLDKYCEKRL